MSDQTFKAYVVDETDENVFVRNIKSRSLTDLPDGGVLVKVHYSSLNYKDALSATGNKGVTKNFPHTPGVDASGVVEESSDDRFSIGQEVIVHGYDLGCNTSGGFGEYIRVPADWVVRLPSGLSLRESMIYGTAGYTAAYSVLRLQEFGVNPDMGEILVTGATGGVGSVAVAILAKSGYQVVASTGKADQEEFLLNLGAKEVISREDSKDESGRPLLRGRWAGAVDTVGGEILATAIKSTKKLGVVTCCGNVASAELPINVYPFILRGVSLVGIDSQDSPMKLRQQIWDRISSEWKLDQLEQLTTEITLHELDSNIELILQGKQRGRVVINLSK
ncbi:MAG: YhdH/YhfP family quinone oxidoreductase [Deltaproteobacteria bacterium]|nr:YhdH/YhfP family quinone oxidoreductase [Deltaproteobacteria bacterium]